MEMKIRIGMEDEKGRVSGGKKSEEKRREKRVGTQKERGRSRGRCEWQGMVCK